MSAYVPFDTMNRPVRNHQGPASSSWELLLMLTRDWVELSHRQLVAEPSETKCWLFRFRANLPSPPSGPGHPGAETKSRRAAEQITHQTPDRVWPAGRPEVSRANSTRTNVCGAGAQKSAAKVWISSQLYHKNSRESVGLPVVPAAYRLFSSKLKASPIFYYRIQQVVRL